MFRRNENRKGSSVFHDICVEVTKLLEANTKVSLAIGSLIISRAFCIVKSYNKNWIDKNASDKSFNFVSSTLCRKEIGICIKNADRTVTLSPKGEEIVRRFKAGDPNVERELYQLFYDFDRNRKVNRINRQPSRVETSSKEASISFENNAKTVATKDGFILEAKIDESCNIYNIPDNPRNRKLLADLINPFENK